MKAIHCTAWGEPEDLVYADVPSQPLETHQVRVGVHAAGINFADTLIVQGKYQEKPPFPFSPGMEVSGEIIEIGSDVTTLGIGDRVAVPILGHGGFVEEYVADANLVVKMPDSMSYVDGAAFTIAYTTSHIALWKRADLKVGETLLVHGAAGGVGLTAVQLGKQMGATVIATASTPEKLALVKANGADHVINYKEENFKDRVKALTDGRGADVIYDPVGGDIFDQSLRCIAWEGRLLIIGFASNRIPQMPANLALVKNFSAVGFYWGSYVRKDPYTMRQSLERCFSWYDAGQLKTNVSQTFHLSEAAKGLRVLMNRQAKGRVVLMTDRHTG